MSAILSTILWLPLIGMLLIMLLPSKHEKYAKSIAAVSAFGTLVFTTRVWFLYDREQGGFQFEEIHAWIPSLGVDYHLAVDGFSVVLIFLNALVFFTGVLSMWSLQERVKEYFAFMLLLVFGVFGVFLSLDLFGFFFFYEVAVLPMYPLIAVWGSTRKEYAAMKLTLYLMGGSALLFPALVSLYWVADIGTWSIPALAAADLPFDYQIFVYPFIYVGFGVLAGMFPFHSWSPTGHVAAPTAVSMLHAGVLMKLGAFGILRVAMTILPEGAIYWAGVFATLATVNIVYGAFVAVRQTDFKFVIGFSSVSHMGIVLLGLNTLVLDGVNGAVFQMFAHGVMTALFFSAVGFIYDQTHDRNILHFGGLSGKIPMASAFFIAAGLCGMGVPGFASFVAELLVFIAAIKVFPVLGVCAVAGLVFTALYMLRVFGRAFFGDFNPKWDGLRDLTAWEVLPRLLLVVALVYFGFVPGGIVDLIQVATQELPPMLIGGF